MWHHHYPFTVSLGHVYLTYANLTVNVCLKRINSIYIYFPRSILLNKSDLYLPHFLYSTKESAVSANTTGKTGSAGTMGEPAFVSENAVLKTPRTLYCVV